MTTKRAPRPRPLILLVDDYPDTVELTGEVLQFRGFDVVTATDGGGGLALAQTHLPDLVLLDLSLPVLDGLEVLRRLRAAPETSHIPVIAFTAHALEGAADAARAAGCAGFLTKPAPPAQMVREIQRVLGLAVDPR